MHRFAVRRFSNARFTLPPAAGEPCKHYAPGSPERAALAEALHEVKSSVVEIPVVIDGKEYFTGDTFNQVMPSSHKHVLAKVHRATPELMQKAIEVANKSRADWGAMNFEDRAMIFRKAGDLVAGKYRARLNAATMLGQAKTVWQAEIDSAVETADFLRLNTNFAQDIYSVQPPLNSPNTWNRLEYRELEGFILAISPFNFSAIGANLPSAPALMGNTVLWKPASSSVLANYFTYQVFQEAGVPSGVMSFLPSAGSVAGQTINHPTFAGLHFTGSTSTFNTLWKQISENLPHYNTYPRIVGETGGKNFHLIHPSADLKHSVFNTLRAAFEYQGQKCSACSRLYVPKSMWSSFRELLVSEVKNIKQGQPDDMSSFMSAVIDKNAFSSHKGYLDRAKASKDVEIIAGGGYDDSEGYFIQPTVLVTSNPM